MRPHLWLIALIGLIVPRRLRVDWRQEWEAELRYRERMLSRWDRLDWRNKLKLLWRSLAAFWDALWLQPQRWEDEMFQDLRFGLRMLLKNPGFTFVAALTLALGIGANTAIFSVVNAVLLRPLPYRDPDRLVLASYYRGVAGDYAWVADFLAWRDQAKAFEQIAAYRTDDADLTGSGEPERLTAGTVSAGLFAMLGVAPALGRDFTPEDDTEGGAPVVILSDGLWRRRFGGDPQVIGRAITLRGQSLTVIGIMPPGFRFPGEADLWAPLAPILNRQLSRQPSMGKLNALARLKPGVTPEAAMTDLSVILDRQRQDAPRPYSFVQQVRVVRLSEKLTGDVRRDLLVMFGAVAFVLLIACANVANLLLARSAARQKEMAIRAAVGAGRLRLVRQLLTESLLLSLLGGMAGLLVARWGVKLLVAMSPGGIARIEESGMDGRVLGFTCAVAVMTGLIAGVFPAMQASKTDVNETLKAQSATRLGQGGMRRALPALMIAELALALVLLVGAGLMIKSFIRLLAVPKGFNPDGLLTLFLRPGYDKYPPGSPRRVAYYQEALARVQALPGVQSASLTSFLPLTGPTVRIILQIEGRPPFERGKEPIVEGNHISPEYFQTMGIPMRAGRPFAAQDGAEAPKVVIINETLARRFFPDENPIGHRLFSAPNQKTIVGVAPDTRHHGLDQEVRPEVYLPYTQNPNDMMSLRLVVRIASDQNHPISPSGMAGMAAAVRNQAQAIEPNEPVNQVITMDERLSNSVAERRFQMLLLGAFAAVALVIATVGIYGVISYAVSQRTQEIGIRMALGAKSSDVLRMVIWRGMSLALIGVALGLAAALALTRFMKNLLFEVSATDPATFVMIAFLVVADSRNRRNRTAPLARRLAAGMGSGVALPRKAVGRMGPARLAEQTRIAAAERERLLGCAGVTTTKIGGRDVSGHSFWHTNDAPAQRLYISRRALFGFRHWREHDAVQFSKRRFVPPSGGGGAGAIDYREPRQRVSAAALVS